MTKVKLVSTVAKSTGVDRMSVQKTIDGFLTIVKNSLCKGESVYARGFGTFVVKKRARKMARNIRKNTAVVVPEHYIVALKPSKSFALKVRHSVKSIKG
jgi:DNA-binding protein HU-beta